MLNIFLAKYPMFLKTVHFLILKIYQLTINIFKAHLLKKKYFLIMGLIFPNTQTTTFLLYLLIPNSYLICSINFQVCRKKIKLPKNNFHPINSNHK